MTDLPVSHLSADDLDLWVEGGLRGPALRHLAQCGTCRTLVERERELLTLLGTLGHLSPRADLADRVMARVALKQPETSLARFGLRRRTAALAAVLVAGMVASIVWSLGNRALLDQWGLQLVGVANDTLWLMVQAVASNLIEQPWFQEVRAFLSVPGRLLLAAGAASVMWVGGLLVLRRLMTLPASRVAHAR